MPTPLPRPPPAASVSLGAPREFLLRRNADPSDKYRLRLGGGALLVMRGPVQEQARAGGRGQAVRRLAVGGSKRRRRWRFPASWVSSTHHDLASTRSSCRPPALQWQHSVPRRQGLQGERISLTFRRIMLPERPGGGGGRGGT